MVDYKIERVIKFCYSLLDKYEESSQNSNSIWSSSNGLKMNDIVNSNFHDVYNTYETDLNKKFIKIRVRKLFRGESFANFGLWHFNSVEKLWTSLSNVANHCYGYLGYSFYFFWAPYDYFGGIKVFSKLVVKINWR